MARTQKQLFLPIFSRCRSRQMHHHRDTRWRVSNAAQGESERLKDRGEFKKRDRFAAPR